MKFWENVETGKNEIEGRKILSQVGYIQDEDVTLWYHIRVQDVKNNFYLLTNNFLRKDENTDSFLFLSKIIMPDNGGDVQS